MTGEIEVKKLVVLIVLMSSLTLSTEGPLQFTGRHGAVELPIVVDRIAVKPDFSQFEDWETILTSDESIDPTQDMRELWGGFFLIRLLDGADPQEVITGLSARPDVAFAYPVFHNSRMENIYLTNHVVVRFSEVLSEDQVDSVQTAFNLSLRTTLLNDSRYQVLQLPPHSLVSPIDIVNDIHAADVQSNAYPSFILPFHLDVEPNDTYWSNQFGQEPCAPDALSYSSNPPEKLISPQLSNCLNRPPRVHPSSSSGTQGS